MKFAIVILSVVAAATAQTAFPAQYYTGQYNPGQYNPGQYNPGQYNLGQLNPYNRYNQYNRYTPTTFRPFVSTTPAPIVPFASSTFAPPIPTPNAPRVVVPRVSGSDAAANIVRYDNDVAPDGSYNYAYETDNGIAAQEQGVPKPLGGNPPVAPVVAQGSFSYTSPEGIPIVTTYIADENGFQAQGAHLPVPPPIPEAIARSLEFIARTVPVSKALV